MNTTTTQPVKVLYTAKTHTTGGREGGTSRTSDGRLEVKLTVPGTKGDGTNPEQLLRRGLVELLPVCNQACACPIKRQAAARCNCESRRRTIRHQHAQRRSHLRSLWIRLSRL